jgi:hypothetical protein
MGRELPMDRLTIGDYTVTFDEQGASIEREHPRAAYRITASTATNAVDFMRYHRTLCFAMIKNCPEDLASYKLPDNAKGGR